MSIIPLAGIFNIMQRAYTDKWSYIDKSFTWNNY